MSGDLNRSLDHAHLHATVVEGSGEEKHRNEEHSDVGEEKPRVVLEGEGRLVEVRGENEEKLTRA
jgi:hypothetical protein